MSKRVIQSYAVWAFLMAFYAFQFVPRILPGVTMNEIIAKFGLNIEQYGSFGGIYYVGYTLAHIPLGILLDKMSARGVMMSFVLMLPLGIMPLLYSKSWTLVLIGRVIVGAGSAASVIGAMKLIRVCFGEKKFSLMLGIMVGLGITIGGLCGSYILGKFVGAYGLDKVLFSFIVMGVALAVVALFVIPSNDEIKILCGGTDNDTTEKSSLFADIKMVLGNKKLLLLALVGGLMVGPLEGFTDLWGPVFFSTVYGFDKASSDAVPAIIMMGAALGFSFLGYIAARIKNYYGVIRFAGFLMLASFVLFLCKIGNVPLFQMFSINLNFLHVLLFIIGVASGYQIPLIDQASSFIPLRLVALGNATVNMIIMIFGTFFHSVIAKIASYNEVVGGAYSVDALVACISPIAGAMGLALIMLFLIRK